MASEVQLRGREEPGTKAKRRALLITAGAPGALTWAQTGSGPCRCHWGQLLVGSQPCLPGIQGECRSGKNGCGFFFFFF